MHQKLIILFVLSFFIFSCGGNEKAEKDSTEKFAENANEKEFKDKHETPTKVDFQVKGTTIEFPTLDGEMSKAYFLKSKEASTKYLFVIHEWWGLNDNIKREAQHFHESLPNTNVMALDLYDGQVADNPDDAGKIMQSVKKERAKAIIEGAMAVAGADAKIATVGWCFGGGWSLNASIMAGDRGAGCVIYYGMPVETAKELEPLKADVLGIFGEDDKWINPDVVKKFSGLAAATGKNFTYKIFDADHAFANPSSPRYVEAAAQEANAMVLDFLKEKLK